MGTPLKIDSTTDIVLLIMAAAGSRVQGTTRLQKLAFLLTQDPTYQSLVTRMEAPDLNFLPYKMGPFDADLYEAVQTLESFRPSLVMASSGGGRDDEIETGRFLEENDLDLSEPADGQPMPTVLRLTREGETVARKLWSAAPSDLRRVIERVVREYGRLPLRELLRRVYTEYPRWAEKSEIRGQLGLP